MRKITFLLLIGIILIGNVFTFAQTAADYIFTTSVGTYTPITGTVSTAIGDDGTQTAIPIGFSFNYCGANYTTFNASTNGHIYFGTSTGYTNDIASTTIKPIIAALWDDLYDDAASDVQYLLSGTAPNRIMTIQWRNIRWNASTGALENFQIQLYETTNVIKLVYGAMAAPTGTSASIGINDNTGGSGHYISVTPAAVPTISTTVANNTIAASTFLTNGLTYIFTPSSCVTPSGLAAASITQTSASLSWTSTGSLFNIQYGITGFTLGSGTIVSGVTTPYSLTGLTASSGYSYYVQNDCGGGTTSNWAGPFSFTTACGAITQPYSQNFDGVTVPALPACWSKITVASAGTPTVTTVTTTPSSSPNCARIYNSTSSGSTTHVLLISPQFSDLPTHTTQIRFKAKFTGSGTPLLHIGTMSDPAVQGTFVTFQSISSITTTWQEFVIPFSGYAGSNQYIAFKHGLGMTLQEIFIDDVVYETIPTCPQPSALTATGITDVSANLNWTPNGVETLWNLQWGPAGFALGTGTMVNGLTAHPYSLTGLTATTNYNFYIQADCGGGDLSAWSGPYSFSTICGVISTFPWLEQMTTYVPNCWTEGIGQLSATTTITGTTSNWMADGYGNVGTTGAARLEVWSTGLYGWLFSPQINLGTGAIPYQLEFDLALTAYGSTANPATTGTDDKFAVVISTDGGTTWTNVNNLRLWDNAGSPFVYNSLTPAGTHVIIPLTSYTGVVKIGFYGESTVSNADNDLFIDNVRIIEQPTCPQPMNLSASAITATSANLGWMNGGSETAWDIQYGITGFALGTGTIVNDITTNPYSLSGLNPSSTYQFYVLSQCSPTDSSAWTGPFSFTTLCGAIGTFPWLEQFPTYLPNCWSETNGQLLPTTVVTGTTSNWLDDGYANVGTTGSARINIYSTGLYGWLMTPQIDLGTGAIQYQLEFDLSLTAYASTGNPATTGTDDKFAVVISTDGGTTWTSANNLRLWDNAGSTYVYNSLTPAGIHVIIPLTSYTGVVKIGFYGESTVSNADNDLFVDNVRIIEQPVCPQPLNLSATSITGTSASVNWIAGGTETTWDIQYGVTGFTLGTGTIVNNVTTNPYTLSGLTPITTYQFYVLSQCSPTDSSMWSGPFSFTTACSTLGTPFAEHFNTTTIPNCWTMTGSQAWLFTNSWPAYGAASIAGTDHTGTAGSFAGVDGSGTASLTGITLTSPLIDVSAMSLPVLQFYLFNNNTNDLVNYQTLNVDIYDGATWHNGVFVWGPTQNNAAWQEINIPMFGYTITGPIQFRFIVAKSAGSPFYDDLMIDDVSIVEAPSCPQPTALNVTNLLDVTASLGWTPGYTETMWDVQYGPTGFTLGTGTIVNNVTTNPYNVSGLTANTAYQFYVLAQCSPTDSSAWTGPFSFTTQLTVCTGTPTAGTINTSANPVCSSINFNLWLTGSSVSGGITYQWQSSPDGITYTNIPGATNDTVTVSQTVASYYQCIVTCIGSGLSDTTIPVQVTLNSFFSCYCTSSATSVADEEIFNVTLGTLNNSSTCTTTGGTGSVLNMYSNYTALPAPNLAQSTTVNFSVEIGTCGGNYSNGIAIWIDYNQNGIFTDAGEKVYNSATTVSGPHIETGSFTIPITATLGNTGMRVISSESSVPTSPCGTYTWGETEDYIVNITVTPTCLQPSALTATNLTSTSADLGWTANDGETIWDIQYGPSGFILGTGTIIDNTTLNPYSLTGLSVATTYQYYVMAQCSPTDSSFWSGPYTFTTLCGPLTPVYYEPLTVFLPNCWSRANGQLAAPTTQTGTTSNWIADGFANVGATGAARLEVWSTGLYAWLMTPQIDLGTGVIPYQLEFDLALTAYAGTGSPALTGTDDKFAVVISTDGGITWSSANNLRLWDNAGSTDVYNSLTPAGTHVIIPLTAYTGIIKIGFYGESTISNADNDLFIDNVRVIVVPTCPQPQNISVTNVTSTTADVSWTNGGTETSWDIQYGISGFALGTGTILNNVGTNPYTLTGLSSSSTYQVYVSSQCISTDSSAWTGPFTFNTTQIPATLPYVWNFDNNLTGWTAINGMQTNKWATGSAVSSSPTNSAYISLDNGTTNTFNITSSSVVHIYRDIAFTAGASSFNLQFKWQAQGESCCDYLQVFLVNPATNPVDGTDLTTGQIGTNYNMQGTWQTVNISIPNTWAGSVGRLVFSWSNDGSIGTQPPAAIDDVMVFEPADLTISYPTSSTYNECGLSATDTLSICVKNVGPTAIPTGENIYAWYQVNLGTAVKDTITLAADLLPNDSICFDFSQTHDFSALTTYLVDYWISYSGDATSSNDTINSTIVNFVLTVSIQGGDTVHVDPIFLPYTLAAQATAQTYDTYLWSDATGTVTGTTASFDAPALGWYYLTVTGSGCSANDSIYVDNVTSTPFASLSEGISVYPNPTDGKFLVEVKAKNNSNYKIELVSADGRIIKTKMYSNVSVIRDVYDGTKLAEGIYYLKITSNGNQQIEKIVIY